MDAINHLCNSTVESMSFSPEPKKFNDKEHSEAVLKLLHDYRQNAFLCDVEIKDIPCGAFEQLLNYAYTSTIDISRSNVQQLLFGASILFMESVCAACQQFLSNSLTLKNCLPIRQIAQQHNCKQLMQSVDSFASDHFQELRSSPEFLEITVEHLVDLLSSSDLHVNSEMEVFETVLAWVHVNPSERQPHLPNLMGKVRLALLPLTYLLKDVKMDKMVQASTECRDLVADALEEKVCQSECRPIVMMPLAINQISAFKPAGQLSPNQSISVNQSNSDQSGLSPVKRAPDQLTTKTNANNNQSTSAIASCPRMDAQLWNVNSNRKLTTRPRKSAAGVVFCVGGRGTTGDPFRTVEAYDWRKDAWFPVTEMGVRRRHVGVVSANSLLFAIGGHDGSNHLDSAECFDPSLNQWQPVESMEVRRRGIAVGALDGAIYAVGGLDDTTCFQTVERYDIELNRWSRVASMNVQRGGVGVAALDRILFAVGGNDGTSSLDSCERYVPHLNKWTLIAHMAHRRAGAGLAVLDGCLYAIGGFDDNAPLNSCERYDPDTDTWHMLPAMSCPRGGVGVAALGGRIYAVGGHDGRAYLDSVEAYDPQLQQWTPVTKISQCRAGAGVSWCAGSVDDLRRPPAYSSTHAPPNSGGGVAYCV